MSKFKKSLRWMGGIFLMLIVIAATGMVLIHFNTQYRLQKIFQYGDTLLQIPTDSASIANGRHLFQIRSCGDCHGSNLGGKLFMNDPMVLELTAPNLTTGKGGLPPDYSTQDWIRTLRHGTDKSGKSLWMMPAHESAILNKTDLANLIAYCQTVPPIDSDVKKIKEIGPIGRILMVLDNVAVLPAERIDHTTALTENIPATPVELGKYLTATCQGCHRNNMKGGSALAPGFPPVPDISATGNNGKWNTAQFITSIREGKTPEGKQLRNAFMPWQNMQHYSDEELTAIKSYLQQLK